MDNLKLYNDVRKVPIEAQKTISAGKLKGFTDINPMWRIKALTEQFGVCGVGWYVEKIKEWTEKNENGEVAVFIDITLFVGVNGVWSKGIFGTGGSMLISLENKTDWDTKEKTKQLVINDECYKMAYTDAISVACKSLGFGADVYWDKDKTKYTSAKEETEPDQPVRLDSYGNVIHFCDDCKQEILATSKSTAEEIIAKSTKYYKKELCSSCANKEYLKRQEAKKEAK